MDDIFAKDLLYSIQKIPAEDPPVTKDRYV